MVEGGGADRPGAVGVQGLRRGAARPGPVLHRPDQRRHRPRDSGDLSTPATASSPAGTYPVTCSGASDPSYVITYGEGTLTNTRVALTVQAPSASKAYGDPVPDLHPSYSGLTNGDAAPATSATCSTTADTTSAVGTYPVTCSGADDPNYDIGYAQGILSVTRVTVTVTADSASRAYGQPNPPLGASFSGFALDQTLATSGVTGSPSCTTTAGTASAPGTYPVTGLHRRQPAVVQLRLHLRGRHADRDQAGHRVGGQAGGGRPVAPVGQGDDRAPGSRLSPPACRSPASRSSSPSARPRAT